MTLSAVLASFFGAALASLGMGGGSILILYLTVCLGLDQLKAQGINLVFFLPVAAAALFLHQKHGLIRWQPALSFAAPGCVGVFAGQKLALAVGSEPLGKLFGGFLLFIGLRELFAKEQPEDDQKHSS